MREWVIRCGKYKGTQRVSSRRGRVPELERSFVGREIGMRHTIFYVDGCLNGKRPEPFAECGVK